MVRHLLLPSADPAESWGQAGSCSTVGVIHVRKTSKAGGQAGRQVGGWVSGVGSRQVGSYLNQLEVGANNLGGRMVREGPDNI